MAQKSIRDRKKMASNKSVPYPDCTVKVKVVKVGHTAKFTSTSGEDMTLLNFSVADSSDSAVATLNDAKRHRLVAEGKSLHLRNFVVRNNKIILTKSSKIMVCGQVQVPSHLVEQAVFLIMPPSPKKKVLYIKAMPQKSVVTVVGKMIKDECIRTVKVGGDEATIHTVRLEDDGQEINLSLWRDMSNVPLHLGQYVEVTQSVTGEWQVQSQLNSTRNTTITHVEAPEVALTGTVEGVSIVDLNIDIALQTIDGSYHDLVVDKSILLAALPNIDNQEDSDEALEESLSEMPPFVVTVTTKGGNILSLSHETEERTE